MAAHGPEDTVDYECRCCGKGRPWLLLFTCAGGLLLGVMLACLGWLALGQ